MTWMQRLRHYWHEIYYFFASEKAIEFAMHCKDVAEKIDLQGPTASWTQDFRLRLHLSLCQACKNYFDISVALKQAVRELIKDSAYSGSVKILNQELLKKFTC